MFSPFLSHLPDFHMWVTFIVILSAVVAYASDKITIELTSITLLGVLLIFFFLFPLEVPHKGNILPPERLLTGFANPALVTVVGLLVIGQAVINTGALNEVANLIIKGSRNNALIAIGLSLTVVLLTSAVLNNTPVVIIFIPVISAIAHKMKLSVSKVMIPLSYVAILGGMTTLIGSSTNLLIAGVYRDLGFGSLGFFDFTIPGALLAGIGFIYVLLITPKLLPDRASLAKNFIGDDNRKFITQIEVTRDSDIIGKTIEKGSLPGFEGITVRMIQRGEHAFLPPFEEDIQVVQGDGIIVTASRKDLMQFFSKSPENMPHAVSDMAEKEDDMPEQMKGISLAEVVITPTSRMVGMTLEQIGFRHTYHCVVLGIQRQARLIRAKLTEIRLAAGDVLLVTGRQGDIMSLHASNDMLLLEWSTEEIHPGNKAWHAGIIFASVVGLAAFNILPITITAILGVAGVLLTRCLTVRQALEAVDSQIILLVGVSLALGSALQATGGALYLAEFLVHVMHGASPIFIMSSLFALMVLVTNLLSNNASGVLFTPIAVNVATQLGVDPKMFVYAVIFACNCSFITPIGYQTNLLVMAPGHHKFSDFIRAGIPLSLLSWATYTLFAWWYF